MKSRFESIRALYSADSQSRLSSDDFGTELWLLLCDRISSPQDAFALPAPVMHYFASHLLQYDVGNGGFAQAAYNCPEWFPLAADGYEALGLSSTANLIREAIHLLPAERDELAGKGLFRATIAQVFSHFSASRMESLNDRIVDSEWYVDDLRVEYARSNADAFCAIA